MHEARRSAVDHRMITFTFRFPYCGPRIIPCYSTNKYFDALEVSEVLRIRAS